MTVGDEKSIFVRKKADEKHLNRFLVPGLETITGVPLGFILLPSLPSILSFSLFSPLQYWPITFIICQSITRYHVDSLYVYIPLASHSQLLLMILAHTLFIICPLSFHQFLFSLFMSNSRSVACDFIIHTSFHDESHSNSQCISPFLLSFLFKHYSRSSVRKFCWL